MDLMKTGSNAAAVIVPASGIDWRYVVNLQIWSAWHERIKFTAGPAMMSVRSAEAAGIRYAVIAVFQNSTWAWIGMASQAAAAKTMINRFSAERDKPVERVGDDVWLRASGY